MASIIHIPTFNDSQGTCKVLCGEVSKKTTICEKESDVFIEMELRKKCAKQTKESLYSHITHGGSASSRLLSSIDYDKGTLKMAILQPKVDKQKKYLKPNEYETTKFTIYLNSLPPKEKIEWHRKIGNIVSKDMIQTYINVKRLKMKMGKLEN
jgi:hypothetical protein